MCIVFRLVCKRFRRIFDQTLTYVEEKSKDKYILPKNIANIVEKYYVLKDKTRHGPYKKYCIYGLHIQTYYNRGILDGPYKEWHVNYSIAIKCRYKQGKLHGKYCKYYPDGTNKIKGFYIEGKKHGLQREYLTDGCSGYQEEYNHGQKIY